VVVLIALVPLLGETSAARAQTPAPVSPADGHVFAWEDVEYEGVEFVVVAPPGSFLVEVEVSRDAEFLSYADTIWLTEESPGLYRGTGLDVAFRRADAGSYYWRPYYLDESGAGYGATRKLSIRPPYRQPSLRVVARRRFFAGKRSSISLHYRPGSESDADRLHLMVARRCPAAPGGGGGPQTLVANADPPGGGRVTVAFRRKRLGRVRLCGYVTVNGDVTRRATRVVQVVRAPATRRQMLRWRLSGRRLGPIRIGMTLRAIERVTGRSVVKGYGDHPGCQIWSLRGVPGLSLMRSYGRVVRVQAYRGRWRTSRGVKLGDPERKVLARYGGVRMKPHPYTTGKYLIVGPRRHRMIFETNAARRVTSFRGGREPQIGYIEGCA
jgi:hypothetical protein